PDPAWRCSTAPIIPAFATFTSRRTGAIQTVARARVRLGERSRTPTLHLGLAAIASMSRREAIQHLMATYHTAERPPLLRDMSRIAAPLPALRPAILQAVA